MLDMCHSSPTSDQARVSLRLKPPGKSQVCLTVDVTGSEATWQEVKQVNFVTRDENEKVSFLYVRLPQPPSRLASESICPADTLWALANRTNEKA